MKCDLNDFCHFHLVIKLILSFAFDSVNVIFKLIIVTFVIIIAIIAI